MNRDFAASLITIRKEHLSYSTNYDLSDSGTPLIAR